MRSVTGMTALRRGGRGFDPIIRGQSQSNLNVIANGAYSYGACPGRMDPPSTYVGVDSFDSVSVIKGHRSVIYGAGGSGGTLIFEHLRPELGNNGMTGSVTTGYTGNSDLGSLSGDFAVGNDRGYVRAFGAIRESGNYEDGNGDRVASAFESTSAGLVAGIELTPETYLEISHEQASEDDVWYAGNGMDAVFADSASTSAKWVQRSVGVIDTAGIHRLPQRCRPPHGQLHRAQPDDDAQRCSSAVEFHHLGWPTARNADLGGCGVAHRHRLSRQRSPRRAVHGHGQRRQL